MRLPSTVFLIEDKVFEACDPELPQRFFMLLSLCAICALGLRLLDKALKISSDNQTGSFLIDLGYTLVERSRGKAAHSTSLNRICQVLKLLYFRTSGKQIGLDPNE